MLGCLWHSIDAYDTRDRLELEIGVRFPAEPNEKIVVKNDGGVRNATASFAFGGAKRDFG